MSTVIIIHKTHLIQIHPHSWSWAQSGQEGIIQFLELGNMGRKLKIDVLLLDRIDFERQSMPNDSMI